MFNKKTEGKVMTQYFWAQLRTKLVYMCVW